LNKVSELGVEEEGSCLVIPKELGFDHETRPTGGGDVIEDGVGEVVGDRSGNPRPDDIVHTFPVGDGWGRCVVEDVVLEGVLADSVLRMFWISMA
jgi:hypothetical protein